MTLRRITAWGLALCFLLAGAILTVKLTGGGHALAATVRMHGDDAARLLRIADRKGAGGAVSSTGELKSALRAARGGETIRLAPGVYSGLEQRGLDLDFDTPVVITSADPGRRAVLTDFRFTGAKGLTFRNVEFEARAGGYAFEFRKVADFHLDRVHVHGTLDGDSSNDPRGIGFAHSQNISITNSEFEQLDRGLAISFSSNVVLANNYVHDLRSDGFNLSEIEGAKITGNVFKNFRPNAQDHPDAIQFWTRNSNNPSRDIVISNNLIMKGEGAYFQGIFVTDQTPGRHFYERVTIADNLLVGTGYNGVRLGAARDVTFTGNELITFAGENRTWARIEKSDRVVATNNKGVIISFVDTTDLNERGTVINKPVKDAGEAAIRNWLKRQTGSVFREVPGLPAV